MDHEEFAAGPGQWIVIYYPPDTGAQLDPVLIFSRIAADAAIRAEAGQRIVSTSVMHLRHAGTYLGQEGSGYTTSAAVAVTYATPS